MQHTQSKPVTDHVKIGGRIIRAGDIVKLAGIRGSFKVKYVTETEHGPEVTLFGGTANVQMFRTVTCDRIGTRKRASK